MKIKFAQFHTTVILLVLINVAMAIATFVETSFGTANARAWFYNATWFEVLLVFLTVNTTASLFFYRSFAWNKIAVPLFHLAFVLVMVGAFFTRYTGIEGGISIREGEASNRVVIDGMGTYTLPFSLYLHDFVLERYPGSQSPSSYSSLVKVVDLERDKEFDYHIYMNHILKYRGWRFFQTSYDQDEKGTYLTATHDVIGTPITYFGYFISIVAMLLALFMPGSFFRKQLSKMSRVAAFVLVLILPVSVFAQKPEASMVVPSDKAKEFGQLVVQNSRGRMKVLNTLNNEFMRKITGKESIGNLNSDQVALSMLVFPEYWKDYPLIKIKNDDLIEKLKLKSNRASFDSFYDEHGHYLLGGLINQVFAKPQNSYSREDKALLALDDHINIIHGFMNGRAFNIFPVKGADNHKWHNVTDAWQFGADTEDSLYLEHIIPLYVEQIRNGMVTGDYSLADEYLMSLKIYQQQIGESVYPGSRKLNAELFYNKVSVFKWLKIAYALSGFVALFFYLAFLFGKGNVNQRSFNLVMQLLALLLLLFHSIGIGLRWYIGGFVPLSNAYETMLFIAWISVLSGLVLARKQPVVLALSLITAFTFMLVAGLNNSNPEIGNLVPVLKSPWLSIHVAVITSSYALFGIVMLAALINLSAFIFGKASANKLLLVKIRQMEYMMQVLLIVGLYTLTIGTIFGAVWANESWGRYWGWDPKETWTLITIFVYVFVSHMRLIPSIKNPVWFNLAAFWAFAAIMMTFFGVNYFLSGMHSYAGTADAEWPQWLLWLIIALVSFSIMAWYKSRKSICESIEK